MKLVLTKQAQEQGMTVQELMDEFECTEEDIEVEQ